MTKFLHKSFSVSMTSRKHEDECYDCRKQLQEVLFRKNGKPHCLTCFRKGSGRIAEGGLNVHIDAFGTPRWNRGLGCFTSSIHEGEKIARRKGIIPIGDTPIERVHRENESLRRARFGKILRDGVRELKQRGK